jgi:vancomycin permeability regulator SanA
MYDVIRGVAVFLGVFSAINSLVQIAGNGRGENLWWIRVPFGAPWASAMLLVVCSVLLTMWGLNPGLGQQLRLSVALACVVLIAVSGFNTLDFYEGLRAGEFAPSVRIPFSAVVAATLLLVAVAVRFGPPVSGATTTMPITVLISLLLCAALFPLAHVYFFGTTDYRAPADAAVVLGARVHPSGVLSQSLEDRVATGAGLYREGLVRTLLMSGGVGESGVDEAVAMKRRAVELGVPAEVILLDQDGVNTDATVANTTRLLQQHGLSRVLVVSQFYHLPRIKMAYRAAGWHVRTVPAEGGRPIAKTPLFVLREIPGFWVYWARAGWRDVFGA